ncbi:hypothetical protein [Sphingomonas alpina]|uniref:Class I SAM-dependent methyltransferase n=1 Tax=Sphingomonas alpina TaxID=653931 RepID=A0A7H0LHW7_9SPHN|nr:hypothetical protein [Sphingomonas alpina]QNQ09270.1 hypothetical protein H3Z74_21790 [Sphingomonas alpina]
MTVDLFEPMLAIDAPKGLGAQMAGGGDKAKRRPLDYYPTPAEATRALLIAELPRWPDRETPSPAFWEPCGRGGAIARVAAEEFGLSSIATDIVADPANDVAAQDLMTVKVAPARRAISNLPFAVARPMVAHLWQALELDYLALLFKTTWLNCGEGATLWRAGMKPTRRWDITWRLDFTGAGNPTMDCVWLIWDRIDTTELFGLLTRDGPVIVGGDLF